MRVSLSLMNPFPHIVDVHAHVYPAKIATKAVVAIGRFYDLPMAQPGTSKNLIASGSAIGVTRYLIHSAATTPEQVRAINDSIVRECRARPDLFSGFGTLHPDMADPGTEVAYILSQGLLGVKLHPDFQRFAIDDPKADPLYAACEGRLPILFHAGDRRYAFTNPARIAAVADRFPRLTIIAAHFGGYSEWEDARRFLHPRAMYFDTSSSLFAFEPQHAADMIRAAGVEKFLFGSDFPMWDHAGEFERFLRIPLADDEREAILWKNAVRLFPGLPC
jgi:predicted TIM-barrel fold metal-dependent hydrolase